MFFTTIAFFGSALIAWSANRANDKERVKYDRLDDEKLKNELLLHIRQDIKLLAFLLMGVIVMLGVVADNIRGGFPVPHF
jgi:hypothetical protein